MPNRISNVPAHKNPKYSTPPGNPTTDKIFLLSVVEVQTYFATDADRKADATRYAVKKGAYVKGSETGKGSYDGMCADVRCTSDWWLRSPGCCTDHAARVLTDGSIIGGGPNVLSDNDAVRPALWVNF